MTTHDQQIAAEAERAAPETSSVRTEAPPDSRGESAVHPAESQTAPHSVEDQPRDDDVRTRDQQVVADTESVDPETSGTRMDAPPAPQSDLPVQPAEPETAPRSAEVQPSDDDMLFAVDPSALRSRWDDIQTAFVDDPSGCVQRADGLVEEVIGQLTSQFADARSHLEAQWARGETASTEDLRVALTRYREFFNRLLAV